jgi:hypothetical protein
MEQFLATYIRTTKEGIRQNRGNVAEVLGFLGRVIHGASPSSWLTELKAKVGGGEDGNRESRKNPRQPVTCSRMAKPPGFHD